MSSFENYDGLCGVIHLCASSDKQVCCQYDFGHGGPHSWVKQEDAGVGCCVKFYGFFVHSSTLDTPSFFPGELYPRRHYGKDDDRVSDVRDLNARKK